MAPLRCYVGQIEALTADGVRITPIDYLTGRADGFDIYVPHRNIESALVCTDAHHRQLFDEQSNRWQSSMELADRQPPVQAAEATQLPAQEPAEPAFKTLGESIGEATKDGQPLGQTRMLPFTPSAFADLLERERQWFEMLMLAGLSPGGSPVYQVRVMLIKRTEWLRN